MNALNNDAWLVRRRPHAKPSLRLFCFPHAGAGSVIFHDWHTSMPATIDVCAIEPPGRLVRRREPAPRTLPAFVDALYPALEPLLDVPFAVFGYSLGALMAFEWLRAVRSRHELSATELVVAASVAPQLERRLAPISREPEPVFVREIERRYGSFEAVLRADPGLFDAILKIMRCDMQMLEDYRYQPEAPLDCPIFALGGSTDLSVSPAELDGWRAQTTGSFDARQLPGGHFFLKSSAAALRQAVVAQIAPAEAPQSQVTTART